MPSGKPRCPDQDARTASVRGERHEQQADNRLKKVCAKRGCLPQARFEARGDAKRMIVITGGKNEGRGAQRREAATVDHGLLEPASFAAPHEAGAHDHEGNEDWVCFSRQAMRG